MSVVTRARWLIPRQRGCSEALMCSGYGRPARWSRLRDGTPLGARRQTGVLGEHAGRVARLGQLPLGPAPGQLGTVDHQVDGLGGHVDGDAVAVTDEGDGTAVHRFGRNV